MASHSQVAHRWAQDEQHGRTVKGFNLFFERQPSYGAYFAAGTDTNVIFSHGRHFPIAAYVTTPRGVRVVLGNFSEKRSVSTSAHQREVESAIPSRYPVFDVPNVAPNFKPGGSDGFHESNIKALLERAAEANNKAKRARADHRKEWETRTALKALHMARDYAAAFGLAAPSDDITKLAEELDARNKAEAAAYAKARKEREKVERERMAALKVTQAADFEAWLAGEPMRYVPSAYTLDENGSVYLRKFEDNLQTSRGASVPWEHAVKAFQFVKLCRERGEGFKTNGRVVRVGHFTVDSIDEHGNMWAGCHYFAWERMEQCAIREGVFTVQASSEAVEVKA